MGKVMRGATRNAVTAAVVVSNVEQRRAKEQRKHELKMAKEQRKRDKQSAKLAKKNKGKAPAQQTAQAQPARMMTRDDIRAYFGQRIGRTVLITDTQGGFDQEDWKVMGIEEQGQQLLLKLARTSSGLETVWAVGGTTPNGEPYACAMSATEGVFLNPITPTNYVSSR